jgi:hypothetical protein
LVWATEAQIQSGGFTPLPSNDPQGAAWERVAREAEQYLKDGNEDAAMAAWEIYYSSAKDPVTQEIFGAEAAINQARLNIERIKRKMGISGAGTPLPTSGPITPERKEANANATRDEVIARRKQLQAENPDKSIDEIAIMLVNEGYNLK